MYKYNFSISLPGIPADSIEEAEKKAYEMLDDLAGSNDGSEFLANAEIDYRGCSYETADEQRMENCNCRASDSSEPQAEVPVSSCTPIPW